MDIDKEKEEMIKRDIALSELTDSEKDFIDKLSKVPMMPPSLSLQRNGFGEIFICKSGWFPQDIVCLKEAVNLRTTGPI